MTRILVTGALGQLGSELVPALAARYGADNIIASDIRHPPYSQGSAVFGDVEVPFQMVDCLDAAQLAAAVREHRITEIHHLAALLSALAEQRPQLAWQVNAQGSFTVLEVAREASARVFMPSSIAAFGPGTPGDMTPQDTLQRPESIYGITKVTAELLCDYYHARFGVDTRGVRFPGLISYVAEPGGGTTDWAVEIFRDALTYGSYSCFLGPDTQLDMMYMPDAIRAVIELMEADGAGLEHRNAFNVAAFTATPAQLAEAIRVHLPDFTIKYDVDPDRQAIADSWPRSIDDSCARSEWGWQHGFDMAATTKDMLDKLGGPSGN